MSNRFTLGNADPEQRRRNRYPTLEKLIVHNHAESFRIISNRTRIVELIHRSICISNSVCTVPFSPFTHFLRSSPYLLNPYAFTPFYTHAALAHFALPEMTHSRSPSPTRWGGVTVTSFHWISDHDVGWHSISWPFPPAFHHSHPTWGESDTPTHWLWEIDWLTCSLMWWVREIRHSSLRTPERKSVVARVSIVDDLVEVWTLWPSYEPRVKWVNPVCGCHWPCKLGNQIVWFANAHASGVITAGPGFLRANKETQFRWAHTRPGTLSRNSYSMSKIDWRTLDEQVPWTSCMPKWYAQRPGFMGSTLASVRVFWIDDQSVRPCFSDTK